MEGTKASGVAKRGYENDDDESSEQGVHWNITLAVRFTKTAKLHAGVSEKSGTHFSRESIWEEAGFQAYYIIPSFAYLPARKGAG